MARNTGKRPHELTLELFAKQSTLTPAEIDAYVKNGPYASKHIWFLRKLGYDISVNKDGRTVLNYVFNGPGTAVIVTSTPKVAVDKAPKVAKSKPAPRKAAARKAAAKKPQVPASTKTEEAPDGEPSRRSAEDIRAANLAMMQKVSAKLAKRKKKKTVDVGTDEAEFVFGSTGEIATSFAVDNGWDSMEGINVRDFLR